MLNTCGTTDIVSLYTFFLISNTFVDKSWWVFFFCPNYSKLITDYVHELYWIVLVCYWWTYLKIDISQRYFYFLFNEMSQSSKAIVFLYVAHLLLCSSLVTNKLSFEQWNLECWAQMNLHSDFRKETAWYSEGSLSFQRFFYLKRSLFRRFLSWRVIIPTMLITKGNYSEFQNNDHLGWNKSSNNVPSG